MRPPHFAGEERDRRASQSGKPGWVDWGVRTQGDFVYVTGTSTRQRSLEEARAAADADARSRLAQSLETRIVSELEHRTETAGRSRQGRVVSVEERQEIRSQVFALATATLKGTKPDSEYSESYDVFGKGWERHYDCWVLVKVPRSEYERQLRELLGN